MWVTHKYLTKTCKQNHLGHLGLNLYPCSSSFYLSFFSHKVPCAGTGHYSLLRFAGGEFKSNYRHVDRWLWWYRYCTYLHLMRFLSKKNPLLWPNGSHIIAIAFVTRYVLNEWVSLFQTRLDHIELFELWTSDLPASLADSGVARERSLCERCLGF